MIGQFTIIVPGVLANPSLEGVCVSSLPEPIGKCAFTGKIHFLGVEERFLNLIELSTYTSIVEKAPLG